MITILHRGEGVSQDPQKWLRNMCTTPNYQRTSMFIGHFALTPEPLVRLSWNFVFIILHTRGRSAPSNPKNVGHPEDCSFCKWPFAKERRRPDHPDGRLQQSLLLLPLDFGHSENRPLCKWPLLWETLLRGTIVPREIVARDTVARDIEGHWYMMILGQYRPILAGIWWFRVSMGQYWLVLCDTGSV